MLTVSVSHFHQHLFQYLDQVAAGETIVIQRSQQEVARLVGPIPQDWRKSLTDQPKLLVDPEELLQPLADDLWQKYD